LRFALFTCFLTVFYAVTAFAAEISAISLDQKGSGSSEVVFAGTELSSKGLKVFEIKGDSPRIVVDMDGVDTPLLKSGNYSQQFQAPLKAIRGAVRKDDNVRFVIDLVPGTRFSGHKVNENKLIITVKGRSDTPMLVAASTKSRVVPDIGVPTPRIKPAIARKPVIVIDAGHGGRDPGALGSKGLREKKVNLSAALELKRQLLATGRYKVVLTRADDRYIEHEDRLRVARVNGADLFISIHADATAGSTARGASVYTLADRAKNRSKRIVNSQNWIMDVDLSEQTDRVGDILVELAQRDTASQSTQFADILVSKLGMSTRLLRNTHRRAGYYVLLAPDVPAVLLELGFISNPTDEKLLGTESHRNKLMRSVVSAINEYFDR